MNLDLQNKNALISGGGTGIGLAVARALAAEKVNVALCGRDGGRAAREADRIREEFGVRAGGFACDVTKPADIDALQSTVSEVFDGIDILINNAGDGTNETIMTAPDEKWLYYWELHVMAAVRLSRVFVPAMRRRGGGVILNNSSICSRQPLGHEPIYNVTKAALTMLSKCLADELISDNIRVNCINPGLIRTGAWEEWAEKASTSPDDYLNDFARKTVPIGRFATTDELADFFVFLCSPRSAYCVGSTSYVDGGWMRSVV